MGLVALLYDSMSMSFMPGIMEAMAETIMNSVALTPEIALSIEDA